MNDMNDDQIIEFIRNFSQVNPKETKGGKRIPEDIKSMARKLQEHMRLAYKINNSKHYKNVEKIAQSIISQDCWLGDNSSHWIEVRQSSYDFLVENGLDSEKATREWLEAPCPIYIEKNNVK
jgi:hypothetical protein